MAEREQAERPPKKSRRRGQDLLAAIYDAVIAELADVGFSGLTMEGIAERAGTSRTPLYRRWSSSTDLVLAAFAHALAVPENVAETGDLRQDLLTHFRRVAQAGTLTKAIVAGIAEQKQHPELVAAIRDRFLRVRLSSTTDLLRRAAARGEISAEAITPEICAAGPSLIIMHNLVYDTPMTEAQLTSIVDRLVLPALTR
ncbi:TetR/AcrR family transcriptional regulator [Flindersiella endophytica]